MPLHVVNFCTTSAKFAFLLGSQQRSRCRHETYVIKRIAVVSVLTAVFLVFANLQTMAHTLILPSRREHPQQSFYIDIEQLRGRDAPSLHLYLT